MWPWGAQDHSKKVFSVFAKPQVTCSDSNISQRIVWKSLYFPGVILMVTWMPWAVWALMRSFQVGVKVGFAPFLCPLWPLCTQPNSAHLTVTACCSSDVISPALKLIIHNEYMTIRYILICITHKAPTIHAHMYSMQSQTHTFTVCPLRVVTTLNYGSILRLNSETQEHAGL